MPNIVAKKHPCYDGLKVTREEYLDLLDDGYRYDMIDGVLHLTPSPFFHHGHLQGRFFRLLENFLDTHPLGEATQETDIFLPDGGDVLRPDLSFILKENLSIVKGHIHGVPDLICEVLSARTRHTDRTIKAERYLQNGVQEYWLLDPDNQTIELWINKGKVWETFTGPDLESQLLAGFKLSVERIFA